MIDPVPRLAVVWRAGRRRSGEGNCLGACVL